MLVYELAIDPPAVASICEPAYPLNILCTMVVFPNCKINIGLNIINKRPDGYHNLSTIFYPVPLRDSLEIIRSTDPGQPENVAYTQSGIPVAGSSADNLCVKAYHLLKADYPQLPAIQLHLHKAIPMGAGLGGGSADGAFTLRLLNDKFQLNISREQLVAYALQLGSDCPFFIVNQPCYASGRGELMEPVAVDLKGYQLVLINPGIHVPTGWAFAQLAAARATIPPAAAADLTTAITQDITQWRAHISNDFEAPVFAAHPELQEIKSMLYNQGAVYASMSGSGSTMYGLFAHEVAGLATNPHWMVQKCRL